MKNTNVLDIIASTLSLMDARLIDHGKNAAFLTYGAMKAAKRYSEKEIDMCLIALIHDIGAFKTEEVNRLVSFDSENSWEHSIYGYLFIKYFSPLSFLAPVVLFHHTSLKFMDSVPQYYRNLAQILHIADRLEISSRFDGRTAEDTSRYSFGRRHGIFSQNLIPLFSEKKNLADRGEFWQRLCRVGQSLTDIDEYLKMIVLSIDFRSRHTVNHTVATAEFSRLIAGLFRLSPEDVKCVTAGALLHDIGKAGIPIEILENPGRLNEREMEIMKTHILLTGRILKGRVDEKVERIACRHHEKLDGSGYPAGLDASRMSFPERILVIADILSALSGARSYKGVFPKEKVIAILADMAGDGLIDAAITAKIAENYDYLIRETAFATGAVTQDYERLKSEYDHLLEKISAMETGKDFQFDFLFGKNAPGENLRNAV